MGRYCQRVAIDFDWPLKQVWKGYLDFSEPYDPPFGDGWQAWEDTSEGSPISPVFETWDDMIAWCSRNASLWAREHSEPDMWEAALSSPPFSGAARIYRDEGIMPPSMLELEPELLEQVVAGGLGNWDLTDEEMGYIWKLWEEEVFGSNNLMEAIGDSDFDTLKGRADALSRLFDEIVDMEDVQDELRSIAQHLGYHVC